LNQDEGIRDNQKKNIVITSSCQLGGYHFIMAGSVRSCLKNSKTTLEKVTNPPKGMADKSEQK
jgi:hypothetical protein